MIDILHQKPLLGRQINWAHPLGKHIIGVWPMNEGSGNKIYDLSGNGNDGTFSGMDGSNWVPGRKGHALDFDGGYIDFGDRDILDITDQISLCVWATFDATGNQLFAPHKYLSTGDQRSYRLYAFGAAPFNISFAISSTGASGGALTEITVGGEIAADGEWYFIVGTLNATTMRLYVNGIEIGSSGHSGGIHPGTAPLYFGRDQATARHDGLLDFSIIYDWGLTAEEVQWLYRDSSAMFQQNRVRRFSIPAAGGVSIVPLSAAYALKRKQTIDGQHIPAMIRSRLKRIWNAVYKRWNFRQGNNRAYSQVN